MQYIIGLLLAAFIFIFSLFGKHLTLFGAIFISAFILLPVFFNLWEVLILFLGSFIFLMVVDKVTRKKRKVINSNILEKSGPRTVRQVLSNGFCALLSVILFILTENNLFMITYLISIGQTIADSTASDIGILSKHAPIDICTRKQILSGLSGGISFLGTITSSIACAVYGITVYFLMNITVFETLIIVLLSMFGNIIDSILGSRLQVKYQCGVCNTITEKKSHCGLETAHIRGLRIIDNCMVNFICNCTVCLIGACVILIRG